MYSFSAFGNLFYLLSKKECSFSVLTFGQRLHVLSSFFPSETSIIIVLFSDSIQISITNSSSPYTIIFIYHFVKLELSKEILLWLIWWKFAFLGTLFSFYPVCKSPFHTFLCLIWWKSTFLGTLFSSPVNSPSSFILSCHPTIKLSIHFIMTPLSHS